MSQQGKFWWGGSSVNYWICTTSHPLDFELIEKQFFAPRKQLLLVVASVWLVTSISLSLLVPFSAAVPSVVLLAVLAIVAWILFGPRVPSNLKRVQVSLTSTPVEDYEYVIELLDSIKQKYARGTLSIEESLSAQKEILAILV